MDDAIFRYRNKKGPACMPDLFYAHIKLRLRHFDWATK